MISVPILLAMGLELTTVVGAALMNSVFNVVLGAGAAGMMCAATAGQRGRRVLLIDHYGVLGEKIRISGGGRCNFTNLHATPANFLSRNPRFCHSALAGYTQRDFIALPFGAVAKTSYPLLPWIGLIVLAVWIQRRAEA